MTLLLKAGKLLYIFQWHYSKNLEADLDNVFSCLIAKSPYGLIFVTWKKPRDLRARGKRQGKGYWPMTNEKGLFFIVRYYSDPIRDEPINIGIILFSTRPGDEHAPLVRFTKNWRRVLCIDPDADTEMLAALEETFRNLLGPTNDEALAAIEKLDEHLSTSLRLERNSVPSGIGVGGRKGVLIDDFEGALDQLMLLYVEDRKVPTDVENDI